MESTELRRDEAELQATYGADLYREIELEETMVSLGRDQIRKQIERAKQAGNESGTAYGKTLIAMSVEKLSTAINEFIAKAEGGGAGRRHIAVKYLKQLNPEIAGFIAMRCVVDSLTGKKQVVQRTAIIIGSRIEDEVRFAAFADENRKIYNRAYDKAKRGTTYHRKKATMAGYDRRFAEQEWKDWPEQDRLHIGALLIDMITSTGLIEVGDEVITRHKTNKVLVPTAKLVTWIERETTRSELLSPSHLPMVVKPLEWTTPFDGGYLTQSAQGRAMLVKTGNRNYLSEMADHREHMPTVYEAVNSLQSTKWQINRRVFDALAELWGHGHPLGGLPSRDDVEAVPCPDCGAPITLAQLNTRHSEDHSCFEAPETLRQWKKDAFVMHSRNVSLRSKRLHVAKTLKIAEQFKDEAAIYFPHQLDFRGRVYCIPSFNPQGNDVTKGLLRFAEGMAIEDGVAAGWLAIQGANVWGYDKASLVDRIQWVEDNEEMILAIAADPSAQREWVDADKPFQFLAFCFEWAGFTEQGYGFVSHLPVALDGSCSGIQHFSAMLRDPVGGAAVNLLPAEEPADIYQQVCDRVVEKLEKDAKEISSTIAVAKAIPTPTRNEEGTEATLKLPGSRFASGWLSLNPSRKTTKRQVMTLPYGSTRYSCREYTEEWLKECLDDGVIEPWPVEDRFSATQYLSGLIWDSIGEVVVAARNAMGWLQECAQVVAGEQLPVYWTTPIGFPVMQQYRNFKSRRVKTKLGDAIVKLSLQEEQDSIDKRRMQNAISPNFVHSMDATHLMMSVCYGADNGISSFALIHDSFGTHAAMTEVWSKCVRTAFVDLYSDMDVLENFRGQILGQVSSDNLERIPAVPPKGTLELEQVLDADFSFA